MTSEADGVWVIGFGNPGRADDGLGPALIDAIEKLDLPGVTCEADYQLTVEDAAEAARHKIVIFADAALCGAEPFWMRPELPQENALGFSSHGIEPGGVLALARDLFGVQPEAYLLGIRGYDFDRFETELSDAAQKNLDAAVDYLVSAIRNRTFPEINTEQTHELPPFGIGV